MESKRKIARVVAVFAVALAAGHFVQTAAGNRSSSKVATPTRVTPVAAGPEAVRAETPKVGRTATTAATMTAPAMVAQAAGMSLKLAALSIGPSLPSTLMPQGSLAQTGPTTSEPAASAKPADCTANLNLVVQPGAIVSVALDAPCQPNERVVLSHEGLAVTVRTDADGRYAGDFPALRSQAVFAAKLADGSRVDAQADVPDASIVRRFGIQWQGTDGFGIHAFEDGAGYGSDGDVSAANPHTPMPGAVPTSGYLTLLGDSTVDLPLLAEIYTWPADPAAKVEIVTEAFVTQTTCGADLLGETLNTFGGDTWITDLTVAMPACDGVGDYLVLKNLALDPKLASAN